MTRDCCHTYLEALSQSGMPTSSNTDPAFTKKGGFSNWKNAMEKKKGFQKRESSDWHNYGGSCKIRDATRNSNRSYWWFAI